MKTKIVRSIDMLKLMHKTCLRAFKNMLCFLMLLLPPEPWGPPPLAPPACMELTELEVDMAAVLYSGGPWPDPPLPKCRLLPPPPPE